MVLMDGLIILTNRDILGMICVQLDDVKSILTLRSVCKKINEIIKNYNKYWFRKSLYFTSYQ